MKKRLLAALLCLTMLFAILAGCSDDGGSGGGGGESGEGGTLNSIEAFMYASLDPHVDYNSWHSQKYGLSESLFRLNDDIEVEPWLAESLAVDGNVATLTIKEDACFSNGNDLTAEMGHAQHAAPG